MNFIERKKFFLVDSSLRFLFLLFFLGERRAKLDDLESLKLENNKQQSEKYMKSKLYFLFLFYLFFSLGFL
ncbi:hypothetical protein LEP1GSC188_4226 [Leptospira weilii serovar Topaz str. LT2116]|uniref:Uncharacterized protein n=2 Tax=Leptospira weilii TaxID=28184 RepID=M3GD44_9LEPT|nr:hypothetical protein LEP1GSC188_4226 [Leptospira weilii serovar Topaz str. LT2116]EMM74184.1 hypothetical protein LEP1GSC038_3202 [Leptospira weilii str. 2006001855]